MLQIRTTVGNKKVFLDLYKDEPVLLNLSFAELQDITKKNSNFSQQFNLPGSKLNNEIFNFFFDLNAIPTDFNPNNKFNATLLWDGFEIMTGTIRLNGVTLNNGEIIYQVTFYNQVGDLMANIGDKFLAQTNLSGLTHPYTDDVIYYSQLDPSLFALTGSTNYSYQNGKTMWGLYNIGYNYTTTTSAYTQFFNATSVTTNTIGPGSKTFTTQTNLPYQIGDGIKCAHDSTRFMFGTVTSYDYKTGTLIVNITATEGSGSHNAWSFTLTSLASGQIVDLFTTPLLQFSPVNFTTGEYNPIPPNFDFSGTPVRDYYFKPTIQVKTLYESICEDAGYEVNSDFFETDYFKHFYMPMKFVDETVYSRNAIPACYDYVNGDFQPQVFPNAIYTNPSSGVTCNSLGWSATTDTFYIPSAYTGFYTFRFTFTASPLTDECNFFTGNYSYAALQYSDGISAPITIYNNWFCDGKPTAVSFEQQFNVTGASAFKLYWFGENIDIKGFKQTMVNAPRFIPNGSLIDYSLEFPDNDYKQIDFITSVNRYFNLVVVPDNDKPNLLRIEPIIDYVGKGEILDWTTKIDFSQTQNLYPTSQLLNGTLDYEFRLDQDYANADFKSQTNRTFGTDKFQLSQEYKDATTKFDYIFSSPIDITINNSFVPLITLSSMSKVKTVDKDGRSQQTFVPFKVLPKITFRGPTLPQDNYGFIGGSGTTTGNSFCTSGVTLNVTDPGYIKVADCFGTLNYQYVNSGTYNFGANCVNASTIAVGIPYADLANFTITTSGTPCGGVLSQPSFYQNWYIDGTPMDRFSNVNRYTTYPFSYTGLSHYCNFRGEDKTNITPSEYSFISPDLYDLYYKPYVDDVLSEENKIYSAKIYLYPQEIKSLNWNEKIIINNSYFRINKITNFNALEPSICDIELVKLTRDYEGHKKLYYNLLSCDSGVRHSNSDLNYHLYSYANNYVKLYDDNLNYLGCHQVQIGTYNPSYNYQHYYIASAFTPNLVEVFDDCGCTGRTQMDIVQQEPGDIVPFFYSGTVCNGNTNYIFSSTTGNLETTGDIFRIYNPTFQTSYCISGITGTFIQSVDYRDIASFNTCAECACILCYPYSMTATTTGLVSWLDCDGILSDTYLLEGQTYYVSCIRQGTINGGVTVSAGTLCFDGCVTPTPTPTSLTPTPTPTSVTPTPTPDPSPTPSATPDVFTCSYYFNEHGTGWIGDYRACDGTYYTSAYVGPGAGVCAVDGTPFTIAGLDLTQSYQCYG